ncbi:MAG: squalene/phytoene synthase family protein, partial [Acidobacteria bacterium]|nr:squalene/phytoene synthase family protein [Acidobacteriota bacterium]
MKTALAASSRYCRRLARLRARNFYYGFLLLPKPRREALYAVYAFMRYCDDVADGEASISEKKVRLEQWRPALERALTGDYGDSPIWPALHHAVRQYS